MKEDCDIHLSIPVHKGKTLGVGLLKKLITRAGLTNEEYIDLFYRKKKI
ncbi:MAG: type II toxin-antitoxin system HicA family toxin [Halobacteriota archaeon]|nr:type II toxin-antitoxin system HicA family toxin [Halobacteriota archaeon]